MNPAPAPHPTIRKLIGELEQLEATLAASADQPADGTQHSDRYRAVAAQLEEIGDGMQDLRREIQKRFPVAPVDSRLRARRPRDR